MPAARFRLESDTVCLINMTVAVSISNRGRGMLSPKKKEKVKHQEYQCYQGNHKHWPQVLCYTCIIVRIISTEPFPVKFFNGILVCFEEVFRFNFHCEYYLLFSRSAPDSGVYIKRKCGADSSIFKKVVEEPESK